MLQRLGSGDLHFRHGEATPNAHALASWKSDYIETQLFGDLTEHGLKLVIGCVISTSTIQSPPSARRPKFGGR